MLPLGVLAASGAGGIDYEPITTTVLGTAAASISFSSIPNTYKHLAIRLVSRNDNGGVTQSLAIMRFNSDSGTNYSDHRIEANASGTVAITAVASRAYLPLSRVEGSAADTNAFAVSVAEILDYTNTNKNKTMRAMQASINSTASTNGSFNGLMSGVWLNTAAITGITISDASGYNFAAGTRATLYGIKG